MREVSANIFPSIVADLVKEANYRLPFGVKRLIVEFSKKESSPLGRYIFKQMLDNIEIAAKKGMPLCQDTGIQEIFVDIGRKVRIKGNLEKAINKGVSKGTKEGYLRASIVKSPLFERVNTKDNTPAVIHYKFISGDKVKITVMPKGFGSENAGDVKMLTPSQGLGGVKDFVLQVVKEKGPNACPPLFVGIGIGGSMSNVTLLAKQALIRPLNKSNSDKKIAKLEKELLQKINRLGIGPQGAGGKITALNVSIEDFPTHIGGLPVCVNLSCYLLRYKRAII
ncbi:MAG: fumarate hydratase [Candidatus Ratteibacteria bacterium]|nr:fumarate hydratase [Candidatus Ratteibacteria bacterium]